MENENIGAAEEFHPLEPHVADKNQKLNWLRASVLGANDGIVSTAALVLGVAGAENSLKFILTAGVAGLVAGAISMGLGEYVSVSAQRDSERALIEKERKELEENPEFEKQELTHLYKMKGLSQKTAALVADELTEHDAFRAHLDAELGIDPNNLVNPWHAAWASSLSFLCGALIPLLMMAFAPANWRVQITFIGIIIALTITGTLSATVGGAKRIRAIIRVVGGGILAMAATYIIGRFFGSVGI